MTSEYYLKLISALFILVGTLFLIQQLSTRFVKKKYTGDILIKDRKALDANNSLLLVKVKGTEFLLGINSKQMNVLEKFEC